MTRFHPSHLNWIGILVVCLVIAISGVLPYSLEVRHDLEYAQAAVSADDTGPASKALIRVVNMQPWRKELWQQAGEYAYAAGDLGSAITMLEKARAEHLISGDGLVVLGDAYLQNGDPIAALRAWKAGIRTGATVEGAFERIYNQQREQHDLIAARITLEDWIARHPGSVEPLYQNGLLLAVLDPEQALPVLLDASSRDPAYANRVETLRKGLSLALAAGDPVFARMQVGRSLATLGEWDLAQVCFEEAALLDPSYAEAWAFLGEARQQLQHDGFADLERASALSPDSVVVQALMSVYYRRQGQPELAVQYLKKIIEHEPDQAIWQLEMGNTLAETGDLVTAQTHFIKAAELEPDTPLYWMELARFSVVHGADVRGVALPAARQALQLAPKDTAVLDMNGQVMYQLGDLASAERFLQRALEIDSAYAPAHLHLGQVYLQWQRNDSARTHLSSAARLSDGGQVGETASRLLERYFGPSTTPVP